MGEKTSELLLCGLVGSGIRGSKSPALHTQEAAAMGLSLSYERFDISTQTTVSELEALLDRLQAAGYVGVNVTHPFKQVVIGLLDDLSPDARALGAVNTVVFGPEGRTGHNTDWLGWAECFRRGLPDAAMGRIVQPGAGGAGSAVAYAALKLGAGRLQIFDLDRAKAEATVTTLRAAFGAGRVEAIDDLESVVKADGLINATPVGMAQYPGTPLSVDLLRPSLWVAEVIYVPLVTALLTAARRIGCRTVDGGGMVVFQAAEALRLFTGIAPDAERMLRAFHRLVADEREVETSDM